MSALAGIAGALADESHRRRIAEQAAQERWRDPEFRRFRADTVSALEAEERHYLTELAALEADVSSALRSLAS